MLYEQSDGKALVVCSSKEEAGFGRSSMECKPVEVVQVSTDELEIVLGHDPRTGRLLTLQLSRDGARLPATVTMLTANGRTEVGIGRTSVQLGGEAARMMRAIHAAGPAGPGLLPLSAFSAAYIFNRDGVVVLIR